VSAARPRYTAPVGSLLAAASFLAFWCGTALAAAALLVALHRWVFALAYLLRVHGRPPGAAAPAVPRTRFATLVPAHDEELLIGAAVDSVFQSDYPREALAVYVIADRCRDATAAVARAHGAHVLERSGPPGGKGDALAHAIEQLEFAGSDAVVIVDADVVIGPGFYAAMDRELRRGGRVLQGYDGIANPDDTMLTRLMAVTFAMKNLLYCAGKSALGFSPLFQGKGMVFDRDLLKRRGWSARGLSEDLEEALRWIRDGERVRFVHDARIYAQEAASLDQARSQRDRWAGGSRELQGSARRMLLHALRRGDWVLAEASLGVMLPNYSKHMNLTVVAGALVAGGWLAGSALPAWPLAVAAAALALQAAEFAAGLWLMRAGWRHVCSVVLAPVFLAWKAGVDLRAAFGARRTAWVRTARHRTG
jgi:1,2-diacylglycerol 3-beta-glucosyltransferase